MKSANFFTTACVFEGSLAVIALILGWLADIQPIAFVHLSESALLIGVVATLPLLLIFMTIQHLPYPSVKQIKQLLESTLGLNLERLHWTDLMVLALIAGFSEELLFRGFLQPWLEQWGVSVGLIGSNLIFGLVHAVTPLYAIFATLTGLYLGLSMDYQGERNLLIPIVIHSLYDFVAFLVILRNFRQQLQRAQ